MDETGVLIATFFRQPNSKTGRWFFLGKVTFGYGFKQMKSPFYEVVTGTGEAGDHARVLPVHPVTEGLSASWMRRIVATALADAGDVCDWLPASLTARRGLMTLGRALRDVHFPPSVAQGGLARRALPTTSCSACSSPCSRAARSSSPASSRPVT